MDTTGFDDAVTTSVKHYLSRVQHVLHRVRAEPDPAGLLEIRLAPNIFETGLNFAIAIQFAARALCPPAGLLVGEIPDAFSCETLLRFHDEVADQIAPISAADLTRTVRHTAGEAVLEQAPADYVTLFALPNMIFHLSLAYAGLRHGGMSLGKADFDGLHVYGGAVVGGSLEA